MGDNSGIVRDGTFKRLDQVLNGYARQQVLSQLKADKPLGEIIRNDASFTDEEKEHICRHWLGAEGTGKSWFPELEPEQAVEILRRGYLQALEVAVGRDLPIESVWICSGSTRPGDARFEIGIKAGEHSVLVLLIANPVVRPQRERDEAPDLDDSWIVGRSDVLERFYWVARADKQEHQGVTLAEFRSP